MVKKGIMHIEENVKRLRGINREIFKEVYTISTGSGRLIIPEAMIAWVKQTFGTTRIVENQKIVKIMNNYTYEGAIFNELRAKRPVQSVKTDVSKTIKSSIGDSFCVPEQKTPYDPIGRLKNRFGGITASNISKYDEYHGLVIFKEHNPLEASAMSIASYILLAKEWIEKNHKKDKEAKYPFIMWNCLWRSGASIIHGHLQMLLTRNHHYAGIQLLREAAQRYHRKTKRDYFKDIIKAHEAIGLAKRIDKETALITPITPAKEKESWIIYQKDKHPELTEELAMRIAKLVRNYITKLGVESFNLGIILPPLDNSWKGFPIIAKIIDRGSLHSSTNDFGAMEVIAKHSIISTDPYKVIEKIDKL
ncbi:hypothetical protein J7K74_01560 [Candidatus Woesearchaeota archaeon]|nr:hypothetical protein [Candidatus Woesearchaeota archaeon]